LFALDRIRLPDRGAVHDRGVRGERLLDLARVHLEAGDDDHLLLAVDDRVVAVLVDGRDVAGVQPAVADRRLRLVGTVVVAVHELRAAQYELARLADAELPLPRLAVDDLALDVRVRDPDRPDLLLPLPVERVAVRDRRRLGEAVPLDEIRAGELDELPMRLDQQRRRTRDARLDGAQVVLLRERRVDDRVVDARRAAEGV